MIRILMLLPLLVLALLPTATHAQVPTNCGVRTLILKHLGEKFGETVRSSGLSNKNQMMEMLVSDANGTWTLLATNALGLSCIVANGTAFQENPSSPTKPEKQL